MSDFKYSRSGGRRDFGRSRRRTELHDAVCDKCGKDCKVPFRPSGDKPIYCSDCFEGKGGRDGGGPRGGRGDRGMVQLGEKIDTLNNKLDVIIELLSTKASKKKTKGVKSKVKKKK